MCIFKSSATDFIILISLFGFLSLGSEAAPVYSSSVCTDDGSHFKPNTTFQANLNLLLSSLVSNATLHDGFYRIDMAEGTPNVIRGLFLCRGDLTATPCQDCVTAAARDITRRCTNQTESIIWYDECMLRYTNSSSFNNIVPAMSLKGDKNISDSDRDRFSNLLASTLNDLKAKAANSPSDKKFATKEENFSSSQKLYSLAQCTPELNTFDCNMCIESAISDFPTCCNGTQGARRLLPGCTVRYELYPFYNTSELSNQPGLPSSSSG